MPEVGEIAPDFVLKDETNTEVRLSDLRGKNVVLIFYPMDFSGTCTKEFQDVTALADKFGAQDAVVYGISVDQRYAHAAFIRDLELKVHLLADFNPKGEVAKLYGVYLDQLGFAARGTFVIDREGVIRYKVVNQPADARNQEEALEALAGCNV